MFSRKITGIFFFYPLPIGLMEALDDLSLPITNAG